MMTAISKNMTQQVYFIIKTSGKYLKIINDMFKRALTAYDSSFFLNYQLKKVVASFCTKFIFKILSY